MDHIPQPRNNNNSLEFPYYDSAAWDHDVKDFHFWRNYGTRANHSCKWRINLLADFGELDKILRGRPFNDLAAFLQSWLYFGMLALSLGRNDLSGFVDVTSSGEKVLSTALLMPLIQERYDQTFQRHMQSSDPHGSYAQEFAQIRMVLTWAERHAESLVRFGRRNAGPRGTALLRIGVSIKLAWRILHDTYFQLERSLFETSYNSPMTDPLHSLGAIPYSADSELWERLIQRGWCPNKIQSMEKSLGLEGLIMASMIHKDTRSFSHAQCDDYSCVANEIQVGQYEPKHADEHHNTNVCNGIGLPFGTAEKVLLNTDSFPVVRLRLGTDRAGSLHRVMEAVPFRDGLEYVAISHVWSDGLGDEKRNRILACQYDRLGVLLSEVMSAENTEGMDEKSGDEIWSPFFWLDTICVPHRKAARRLACARMASSYEYADTVLVLDAELQAWPYTSGTDEEALLRIVTSGWTTRVWTLSEGILAKRLCFKLADTMFDYASCGERLRSRRMRGLGRFDPLPALLYNDLKEMRSIRELDTAQKLVTAMTYTQSWRTSHPGDEIISLAVVMGMNCIEDIYDQPSWAGKMKLLFEMMPELSLRLLFSCGPRLWQAGFRWAPASLTNDLAMEPMQSLEDIAHLDRKSGGLVCPRQGLLLYGDWTSIVLKTTHGQIPRNHSFYPFHALYRQLPVDDDLDYHLATSPDQEDWCFMESSNHWRSPCNHQQQCRFEDEQYWENDEALANTALAVIIDAPNFAQDRLTIKGVLVSNVILEDSGIISCRYESLVILSKCWRPSGPISSEDEVLYTPINDEMLDITGVDQAVVGTYRITKSSQVWRVM